MKLTGWYGYDQKPARPGVYQTEMVTNNDRFCIMGFGSGFSLWNGKKWMDTRSEPKYCTSTTLMIGEQRKMWRGIAK